MDSALRLLARRGLEAWPELAIDEAAFVAHLRAVAGDDAENAETVARTCAEDLALAFAAGSGSERAIALVESTYFGDVAPILARMTGTAATRDELVQVLRDRLFVASAQRRPGILAYGGRGDLRGFLRVTITRAALNLLSRKGRDVPTDDALFEAIPDLDDDPEVRHIRARCREEVRAAFRAAFQSLTPRERNLLRHAFLDGLGIDGVGRIYGVHRATAARWLASARAKLVGALTADLETRLQIAPDEVASLLRWARSGIELTLEHSVEPARPDVS